MKNEKKDLLIIGGGALGAFHAHHALEMGLKVTLLEKDTAPKSASVRNFGQIVPSGMNQKWQAFGRKSLDVYAKLQSRADLGVMHGGSIYLASDAGELQLIEELAKINKSNGYPSELLTPKACLDRYPCLQPWYCRGGLYFPQELSVNPRTMVHRLLALLKENPNFNYLPNTLAKSIDSGGVTCKVSTANGDVYEAEQVILCSGTEFEHLYPGIFRNAGLEMVKIQMARIKAQPNTRIPGNILTGLTIRRYESFAECPSYHKIKATEDKDSFWKKGAFTCYLNRKQMGVLSWVIPMNTPTGLWAKPPMNFSGRKLPAISSMQVPPSCNSTTGKSKTSGLDSTANAKTRIFSSKQ